MKRPQFPKGAAAFACFVGSLEIGLAKKVGLCYNKLHEKEKILCRNYNFTYCADWTVCNHYTSEDNGFGWFLPTACVFAYSLSFLWDDNSTSCGIASGFRNCVWGTSAVFGWNSVFVFIVSSAGFQGEIKKSTESCVVSFDDSICWYLFYSTPRRIINLKNGRQWKIIKEKIIEK